MSTSPSSRPWLPTWGSAVGSTPPSPPSPTTGSARSCSVRPGTTAGSPSAASHVKQLAEASSAATDPVRGLAEYAAVTDADQAAAHLQAHGIPAYPVRDGYDLVERDPQLAARFYPALTHSLAGKVRVEGVLHHLADTPPHLDRPAPLLGENTEELLSELLGTTTQGRSQDLREQGVLA